MSLLTPRTPALPAGGTISMESVISSARTKDMGLRRLSPLPLLPPPGPPALAVTRLVAEAEDVGVVGVTMLVLRFTWGDWCGGKTGTPPRTTGW